VIYTKQKVMGSSIVNLVFHICHNDLQDGFDLHRRDPDPCDPDLDPSFYFNVD
jgi:hypothetical protein